MMKISKPVLMNDFVVSHVQFTSLNLINFKNVKPVYDRNEKILLEYEHPSKVEVSPEDWIGIFPRGWSNLRQYVTFEWTSQSTKRVDQNNENGDVVRWTINFCPKYHMNFVNQSAFYQFVFVHKRMEVLGVSSYFRFDTTCLTDSSLELECLVPVTGKIRSTSVSDLGTISMANKQSSTSLDSRKLIHTSSIHSLQNLDVDAKLNWSRMNFTDDKKNLCLMKTATATPSGTGDNLDPYSSHSEPVFPMSLPFSQCKKCYQFKRGGDFLRSQQVLQSKLKIVMERNKVLEERTQEMKKELERLQNESKRMKMSYYNVNKEKVAYEKFVKDFIKSLEKDSIVRVMYANTEILVKKVNYVGMEEHPRDKKTSKRERELKAVIGLQEITIRNLINSLQEKAKSVEVLNETVKLAQVFSSARTETKDMGIEGEENSEEICNADVTSEYEFSLAKPAPPEEVSEEAEDVLDSIRRTSEMELQNIGIKRSLGRRSESELDVTNLSVMSFEGENVPTKKPHLVDNVEDCWPFPRNPTKTLRQKLSEDNLKAIEQGECVNDEPAEEKVEEREEVSSDEVEDEKDVDATNCEDYYDAYDAFSVRSYSPESETSPEESPPEEKENVEEEKEEEEKVDESEKNEFLLTAIVPKQAEEDRESSGDAGGKPSEEKAAAPEKLNKFTCELSIDFVQKRGQGSERAICAEEQSRSQSEQNLLALRGVDSDSKVYTLERERSLMTFKKSNKCLEIKITKVDQKESPNRGFQQTIVLQFAGDVHGETGKKEFAALEQSAGSEAASSGREDAGSVTAAEASEETKPEAPEIDAFSPRTEWNDAREVLEIEDQTASEEDADPPPSAADLPPQQEVEEVDDRDGNRDQDEAPPDVEDDAKSQSRTTNEKMMTQFEEKKSEITEQFLKSKCNIQNLTEDSIKNLKIYQDSLRYEKNLQFLNNKFEGKGDREGDEDTLKEKPSAILIQSGQAKVAVIRYQ